MNRKQLILVWVVAVWIACCCLATPVPVPREAVRPGVEMPGLFVYFLWYVAPVLILAVPLWFTLERKRKTPDA